MEIYQVGGAVRDRLLGRPVEDRDWVVVGATPEDLIALGYRQVGRDFPVFLHPQTHEEYALARTERKQGVGYRGFEFATTEVTLEQDLARRDLTINAIAEDHDGNLIDPYDGRRDLAEGILRHVTAAFSEDPLRVLRVARFAARFDYRVASETLALMRTMSTTGELATLAPERVWRELQRALCERYPARFIEVLRSCGALGAIFPSLDRLFGIPQPAKHHPEIDTGVHMLLALSESARVGGSTTVRFAVLLHDLGKAETASNVLPSHPGHEERGAQLVGNFCAHFRVPVAVRDLAVLVARYHVKIHRALELRPSTLVALLEDLDAFRRPNRIDDILLACQCDALGRGFGIPESYPQAPYLRAVLDAARAVDAQEIVSAGLEGGAVKVALHKARIAAVTAQVKRIRNVR
ncbi:MAG: multifunctional CCA addition/repair protein [Gammaproteobacteria bacterium]|nr:multifunctional CCA addition/repair protein [Gammaproteobacteria bacterium]